MNNQKALEIAKIIEKHDKIVLFHHNNIDGDSFSSSYGLLTAIKKRYPNKDVRWKADVKDVEQVFPYLDWNRDVLIDDIDSSWLAIIGDTSSNVKLQYLPMIEKAGEIVCFDHHEQDISIKHDYFWHEPHLPASTMQAIEIAKAINVEFDEEIAFNLMIGLLTDTANFSLSLNDPEPARMWADLLEYISEEKMDNYWKGTRLKTRKTLEFNAEFMSKVKFDKKVVYVEIDEAMFKKYLDTGYKQGLSLISNIEGYPMWAIFVEYERNGEKLTKIHTRSIGPDVSKIAIAHGGSGHVRAAGFELPRDKKWPKQIVNEMNALLD